MLQIPRTTLMTILIAIVALTLVGATFGTFLAFLPESTGGGPSGKDPGLDTAPASTALPPAPEADPREIAVNGVSLKLVDVTKSTNPKGVELVVELANQSSGALNFAFYPERDITLRDDQGSNYNFRWAEYKGEVTVDAGQKTRLVRVFFAGPDRDVTTEKLMLAIANLPQVGKANWEINWPASAARPTQIIASGAAAPAPAAEPDKSVSGVGGMITQNKISLTLTAAEPNSELGGVLVTMFILNNTAGDLSFLFSPERQLTVVDSRGTRYNLRWAEYNGNMKVARGQQVQLVKAFFDGPVADPLGSKLTISVAGLSEFGGANWQVPLKR
ncbi:MAG: hypothetical protein HYX94_03900 [Chloroflexi bacterium]|nr:hypothetical protein [Chloroflexota bacterium]